ncbi:MAG TPA: hypothetical protein VHM19_22625, partial [Polyangiales bacterium]|nr:hypothetical protein [Polyangiales bacterium]
MKRSLVLLSVCVVLAACGGSAPPPKHADTLAPADPRAARIYLDGVALLAKHDEANDERALRAFEDALEIDPHLWEAEYNTGVLYRRRGEARKALPHFEAAHRIQR